MAPEILVFMPNGDVTLTLIRNVLEDVDEPVSLKGASFGKTPTLEHNRIDQDTRPDKSSRALEDVPPELEYDDVYFAPDPPDNEDGPFYPPAPRAKRGSDASSRRDRSTSPPASFWASLKRQAPLELVKEDESAVPSKPAKKERVVLSSHEVHCVVSSRHMMLASHYFQTVLSGNYNEGITLRSKGHVSIPLLADLDAMIILLNIVHGASRKVPRQVTLEVLRNLAILVSNFGMVETVQFFSDTWIDNLQSDGLPLSYNETVLPMVFLFWVFDRPDEFKTMTRLAQRECDETLNDDAKDVPIPHGIIDAIKRDREFALETAIAVIHTLITRYLDGRTICDGSLDDEQRYACDSMALGSLMKSSRKIGIWPQPEAPFPGRKFKDLARALRSIKILDVCYKSRSRRLSSLNPTSNCHGLEDSIEASMKSLEAGLEGLELSDYSKKSDSHIPELQMHLPELQKEEMREPTPEIARNGFQTHAVDEPFETAREDVKDSRRESLIPESRSSTRQSSREREEVVREVKVTPRQYEVQQPSPRVSPNFNVQKSEERAPEIKAGPRSYSRDIEHGEQPAFRKTSVQEVDQQVKEKEKTNSRDSPTQGGARITTSIPERNIDNGSREELKPVSKDVKALAERTLNRTNSFTKLIRNEARSPVKEVPVTVTPRSSSIEEISAEILRPVKVEVKPTPVQQPETREVVNETSMTTDGEETWAPTENFKIRKSKKNRFATRF